jgi:hypothetical protein
MIGDLPYTDARQRLHVGSSAVSLASARGGAVAAE